MTTKVARLIAEYDLDEMGERLERRWVATGERGMSLRELAEFFNLALLRESFRRAGTTPVDPDVRTTYEILTDPSVETDTRTRKRRQLEGDGIDVESIERDFVSHQAIYTYLTEERDVEFERPSRTGTSSASLARLQNRLTAVAESAIANDVPSDGVEEDPYEVLVDVSVLCRDCGREHRIDEFLDDGGCSCA